MAQINMDLIMAKIENYSETAEGKKRIKSCVRGLRERGVSKTDGGGEIVSTEDMKKIADDMIRILKECAFARRLPASVAEHFNSLTYSGPYAIDEDQYKVDIYFTDDLSRFSLKIATGKRKGERTGEGIKNIVSLFDTGYSASDVVYGIWDGHEDSGVIRSREQRNGLHFMREAVDVFNRAYGDKYGVYAEITADQEFYAR